MITETLFIERLLHDISHLSSFLVRYLQLSSVRVFQRLRLASYAFGAISTALAHSCNIRLLKEDSPTEDSQAHTGSFGGCYYTLEGCLFSCV